MVSWIWDPVPMSPISPSIRIKIRPAKMPPYDLLQCLDMAGLNVRLVESPAGHDPNSYFTAGATAQDFAHLLEEAALL